MNENMYNQNNMNSMPTQTYNVPNNSGQGNKNIIFIIVGVIVVVVIGVLAYLAFGNKSNGNTTNTANTGTTVESTPVATNSYYKVNYSNFTFSIPDNLQYGEEDGYLIIANEDDTWEAGLQTLQGSFESLKRNSSQLTTNMTAQGYNAKNVQTKTYNGVEFVTLEVQISGYNQIFAYTKLNSMYIAGMNILNVDNDYDYEPLNDLATVIKSAIYNSGSNSIKGSAGKVNHSAIESIAK